MLDPFKTKVGIMYNYEALSKEFQEFLIKNAGDLQYEFKTKEVELVFITGKNDAERDLSVLNHPLYVNNGRREIIFVDLRMVIKPDFNINNGGIGVQVRDMTNYNIIILRTMFTVLQLEDKDELRNIRDSIAVMFSRWIAKVFAGHFSLKTYEPFAIEAVCSHYFRCILSDEDQDKQSFIVIKNKIANSKVPYFNLKYLDETLADININPKNIDDLISNIVKVVDNDVINSLDAKILYNAVDRSWFGMNSTELLSVAIEEPYTFAAIAFEAINNNSHKRSLLTSILKDRSAANASKSSEYIKSVENLKKEFSK